MIVTQVTFLTAGDISCFNKAKKLKAASLFCFGKIHILAINLVKMVKQSLKIWAIYVLLLFFPNTIFTQANYSITQSFTTNNGLPSNNVYRCVEDNNGFLWVATDAGIARFDGKYFQLFTTQDGLPDNEVLNVLKDNDGTIWAICFKHNPAYFDAVQNKFINATENKNLQIINGKQNIYGYALSNLGVMFSNENGCYIVKNKTFLQYPTSFKYYGFLVKPLDNVSLVKWGWHDRDGIKNIVSSQLVLLKSNVIVDSLSLFQSKRSRNIIPAINNKQFYLFKNFDKKCYIYSNLSINPLRVTKDSFDIPETYFDFAFTHSFISFSANSGKVYLYDKNTLQLKYTLSGNYIPNNLFEDSKGNLWLCTLDKGLILYKTNSITKLAIPNTFKNSNFLSIAIKSGSSILAGNYNGEIVEQQKNKFKVHYSNINGSSILRKRDIIISQNKVFSFTDMGIFVNYTQKIASKKVKFVYAKTALAINDSFILLGTNAGLDKLNTIKNEVTNLYRIEKRVTALAKNNTGIIYYGSLDGLGKYDFEKNKVLPLQKTNSLLYERIMAITITPDDLIWIATSSNGVVVLQDDRVVLHLTPKEGLISNSIRCITKAKNGEIWIGSFNGLSKLNYTFNNRKLNYTLQNLTAFDGLTSNIINQMQYANDTIYAATSNGVSIIPCNILSTKYNIPVQIIGVRINQRDTIISSNYQLKYAQQNIEFQFAAIELNGHFKTLQYKLNNTNWVNLPNNTLLLQLSNGIHSLQVRAIDVNQNISTKILYIQVIIETPFWKTLWFWIICIITAFAISLYFILKRNKQRAAEKIKQIEIKQQLAHIEMQAIKAQINPHFIFNCLNSIKSLNFQKRYTEADLYTDKFSELLRNVLDYSSEETISLQQEINYLNNYISLEQLRFGDKLQYSLTINKDIDTHKIQIPALLLQPYVENAIKHGIGNLIKSTGFLSISIELQHKNLLVTIEDNGIGRIKAQEINNTKLLYPNSKGMELNKRRAMLFNIDCTIIDKENEYKLSLGTIVELRIPITQ